MLQVVLMRLNIGERVFIIIVFMNFVNNVLLIYKLWFFGKFSM